MNKHLPCLNMCRILDSIQVFLHSCLPFLDFFGHVIHLWILDYVDLIETYVRFLHTLFQQ